MTPKQLECYEFIKGYIQHHGFSPTVKEISDHLGLAKRWGASRYIDCLVNEGLVIRYKRGARNLKLVDKLDRELAMGRVFSAASELIDAMITARINPDTGDGVVAVKAYAFQKLANVVEQASKA